MLATGLEGPAELTDAFRRQVVGAGDYDGVGTGFRQGLGQVVEPAEALHGRAGQDASGPC
ncbi:hypothetical protein [Curtobacterium sp. MCJR17_043]|uniref:hypothetical protein n=1 Tax=Curtobacterium sp. MCJR17_043 TaxID=2175660 RepID=UPI0024DFBD48|nr:hypothetical protein [Curtobacterium sp. MCJR17_043]WIB36509.1 hypothetical protein DEJ15_05130 [Curtobacterium sp. MCJR17_043]